MDFEDVTFWFLSVVVGFVFLSAVFFFVVGPFIHIPKETGNGQHVGYVTAVEDDGLIWRTGTVYVKTQLESSQEDQYCVDPNNENYDELMAALRSAADSGSKVRINYYDVFWRGIRHCNLMGVEAAIVRSVEVIS